MTYDKQEAAYREWLIESIEKAIEEMSDNPTPTLRLVK